MRKAALLLVFLALLAGIAAAAPPHVVVMIGEDEYKTWETLPAFAKSDLEPRGWRVTLSIEERGNKGGFPGFIEAMRDADLLLVSVRRRTPPRAQLDAVRAHLAAGRPLVGIRTASHAFALREKDAAKFTASDAADSWQDFDATVLGGNYQNHHPEGPRTALAAVPGEAQHAILRGVDLARFTSAGSLYRNAPLRPAAKPLLIGTIPGQTPEPVAWTHACGGKNARVFYTSLGHPGDFADADFRRLLVNAMEWALGK